MAKTPENEHPVTAFGWAAREATGLLLFPFNFSRRATGEKDVRFKVLYCAICGSDLKALERTWGIPTTYPVVPGHEITGIVTEVGSKVSKFKVGDKVGVGGTIGSCRHCYYCLHDLENYCPEWMCAFNTTYYDGTKNYGGFSDSMVVDEHFCIGFPDNMPLDRGAPLLCAGIAAYSALKYYGLAISGLHIGVLGLGGIGHLAVKFLKAFGARVTIISTSPNKKMDALEHFGADSFLFSSDPAQMEAAKATMDGIFDTAPKSHPISPLLSLLKVDKKLVVVGEVEKLEVPIFPLIRGRNQVAGSMIGGQKEIQEMIYFASEHNIMADNEIIPIDDVNKAMERLSKDDIRYRFVIDIANTLGVPRA